RRPRRSAWAPWQAHTNLRQPVVDSSLYGLSFRSTNREKLAISFHSAPRDESVEDRAVRAQLLHGLEAVAYAIAGVRVERDDSLASQVVSMQEALDRRRQLHAPGGKPEEHDAVLSDAVDPRRQRR